MTLASPRPGRNLYARASTPEIGEQAGQIGIVVNLAISVLEWKKNWGTNVLSRVGMKVCTALCANFKSLIQFFQADSARYRISPGQTGHKDKWNAFGIL